MTVPADTIFLNDINPEVQQLLTNSFPEVTVTSDCAIRTLQTLKTVLDKETFIFLDPPYLHETRSDANLYDFFEMTDDDHELLLSAALEMKCNVMIIHPKCELYDTMLVDWRKIEVKIRYHRKTSIEVLYMNYPEPTVLQTYDFLGSDCWDCQRIKRKGDRMVKKLLALPELERNYILERLGKIK